LCPPCNSGANAPNARGEVPGGSETSKFDPNGEDFGGYGSHRQSLGAIWRNGAAAALRPLPGGNNATAFTINNRGQIAGFAETADSDPACANGGPPYATPFQVRNFLPVIWQLDGRITKLSALTSKGDTVAYAFDINDGGEVAGASGACWNTSIPPAI